MNLFMVGDSPFTTELEPLLTAQNFQIISVSTADYLADPSQYRSDVEQADGVLDLTHVDNEGKRLVVRALDLSLPADRLLMSSTLTVNATTVASWTEMPARVVGVGLLPPLNLLGVGAPITVELAAPLQADPQMVEDALKIWQAAGQHTELVADSAGMVRARVIACLVNEAVTALQENVAEPADIDLAMRLGTNYPLGPLTWGDHLGLDVVLQIMCGLFDEWGDDRYRPAPMLRNMVAAGMLGKKSGRGFYTY